MKITKWLGLFLSIVAVIGLAACSSTDASKSSSNKETKKDVTLRVGQTGWGAHEEALKAAGLDKDLPYKVEYSVFQGGNLAIEAMAAGHLDSAVTSEICANLLCIIRKR